MSVKQQLRAIVVGAGSAGEGHALALRHTGVEVVALCARQPAVVQAVADRLAIPRASTDWRHTLETVKPDIVALATPAALRGEVIEAATALGCHLYCDKPLATTAEEAKRLYRLVERAGVKHAYAATGRYDPSIAWLGELVGDGAIGTVREIACTFRLPFPLRTPWSWWDVLTLGGGWLNQILPHVLGVAMTITGGEVQRVMGQARLGRRQAPVVPDIHHFDVLFRGEKDPTPEAARHLEWRGCDADGAFTALMTISSARGEVAGSAAVGTLASTPWPPNGWGVYGDEGTLLAEGDFSFTVYRLGSAGADRELLPVPQRMLDALAGGDWWAALADDFVADLRGEAHRPYLTFRDGWRFQEAIDAIRAGGGWYTLPT